MKTLSSLFRSASLTALLALAACGGEAPADNDPEAAATRPLVEEGAVPEAAVRADAPRLTLMGDGLIIGTGEGTTLPFGMTQDAAIVAMRQARGMPQITRNAECGVGTMDSAKFGPVTLNFTGGKLTGWHVTEGGNAVTVDGMSPGLKLDDVRSERSVEMTDSTLDGEFTYGLPDGTVIGGFAAASGQITSLHAGETCFFR